MGASHHLFVCTSCRQPGEGKKHRDMRSGEALFRNLSSRYAKWARREDFAIVPYECLSACKRACGVAMRAPNKFTYVFGDVLPNETESAVIECATLYRSKPTGFMPRDERPHVLRASILSRVPPLEGDDTL